MRMMSASLLIVMASFLAAQTARIAGNDEARILSLENAWNEAEAHHDVKALGSLLGDPFAYTDEDGSFKDKGHWLAQIAKGSEQYEALGNDEVEIHLFGDTAVVVGEYHEKLRVGAKITPLTGRFTDTWIEQGGQWKCVASQSTLRNR
jgi:ketosteroid isomerase-like protein